MTSPHPRVVDDDGHLDEQYVQDAFHSYLKFSLAQAKVEHLLDVDVLSSAEGDLMITGVFKALVLHSNIHTYPPIIIRPRFMPLFRGLAL
jgi:hypothetical protein